MRTASKRTSLSVGSRGLLLATLFGPPLLFGLLRGSLTAGIFAVNLSFWTTAAVFFVLVFATKRHKERARDRFRRGACTSCGYPRSSTLEKCTECGLDPQQAIDAWLKTPSLLLGRRERYAIAAEFNRTGSTVAHETRTSLDSALAVLDHATSSYLVTIPLAIFLAFAAALVSAATDMPAVAVVGVGFSIALVLKTFVSR
ncbi:MAG: hypothetical protein AAGF47_07680 [Planctomycetota bacterium]